MWVFKVKCIDEDDGEPFDGEGIVAGQDLMEAAKYIENYYGGTIDTITLTDIGCSSDGLLEFSDCHDVSFENFVGKNS